MIPGITAGQVMPHRWSSILSLGGGSTIRISAGQPLLAFANFAGTGNAAFEILDPSIRATFTGAGSMVSRVNYRDMRATFAGTGATIAWHGNLVLRSLSSFVSFTSLGPVSPASQDAFSEMLTFSGSIVANSSFRQVITPLAAGGNYVRVSFKAGNSAYGLVNCSVGIQSTTYNTVSTPIELTFNGVSGFSIAAHETITSDWAPLVFSSSDSLIIIGDAGSSGGTEAFSNTAIGCTFYNKTSAISYNVASPPGSWSSQANTDVISLIEAGAGIGSPALLRQIASSVLSGASNVAADATIPFQVYQGSVVFSGMGALIGLFDSVALRSFADRCISAGSALSGSAVRNYANLLNGLTADGLINADGTSDYFDALYILAAPDETVAKLNLISNSFPLTTNGSPAFVANQGYTGVAGSTTVRLNTGFAPSTAAGKFTRDNAHLSAWSNTNVAASTGVIMGATTGAGANQNHVLPRNTDLKAYWRINDGSSPSAGITVPTSSGFYCACRSGSSAQVGYKNAIDMGVTSVASGALGTIAFYILAYDSVGSQTQGFGGQVSVVSMGANLSSTQVRMLYERLSTYRNAVGLNNIWLGSTQFGGAGGLSVNGTIV